MSFRKPCSAHAIPQIHSAFYPHRLKIAKMVNQGLAAKSAADLQLLRSLGRLFSYSKINHSKLINYSKFISSLSEGIRAFSLMFFKDNLLFCNLIEAFF